MKKIILVIVSFFVMVVSAYASSEDTAYTSIRGWQSSHIEIRRSPIWYAPKLYPYSIQVNPNSIKVQVNSGNANAACTMSVAALQIIYPDARYPQFAQKVFNGAISEVNSFISGSSTILHVMIENGICKTIYKS